MKRHLSRSPRRLGPVPRLLGALMLSVLLLSACSDGDSSSQDASSPSADASASATEPATATPAPKPEPDACRRLSYQQAMSPTNSADTVPCRKAHSAETYAVGELDSVVDGHLLAVDAARVQDQPAEKCTPALRKYLGGSLEDLRLSMLRPVWFTPTIEESDQGANWYRCDVVAVSDPDEGKLAATRGSLKGVLGSDRADDFGMCSAGDPTKNRRVLCRHNDASWQAISVFEVDSKKYPGRKPLAEAGSACEDVVREQAEDPLSFEWAFDAPTKKQWEAGRTYGTCWAEL